MLEKVIFASCESGMDEIVPSRRLWTVAVAVCVLALPWMPRVSTQYNTPGKHPTLLIPDRTTQFCKFCNVHLSWLWSPETRSPYAKPFFCPKRLTTWLSERKTLTWIFLCGRWSVSPRCGLFRFRNCVWYPYLVPGDYTDQEFIHLVSLSCQKGQCAGQRFHFVWSVSIFGTQWQWKIWLIWFQNN